MLSVTTLDLAATEFVDGHVRRCVFWEADAEPGTVADPEFEKEAWLSRVLLEWGACGQVARTGGQTVGVALYAPPRMVPGAGRFPTAPASADAVLLTALHERAGVETLAVRTRLVDSVVADLRSRGVKALEAFGRADGGHGGRSDGSCGELGCVTSAAFLVEHGFTVVADDPVFPRLRLEIEAEHQWKADVERALDQLFAVRAIPTRVLAGLTGVSARAQPRSRCS